MLEKIVMNAFLDIHKIKLSGTKSKLKRKCFSYFIIRLGFKFDINSFITHSQTIQTRIEN